MKIILFYNIIWKILLILILIYELYMNWYINFKYPRFINLLYLKMISLDIFKRSLIVLFHFKLFYKLYSFTTYSLI